jgi:acyl-CoA hydrolase
MKVVTVSIDHTAFVAPICIGDHVLLRASANFVGNTSMEVGVRVTCENPYTGKSHHATTAYLTFVGLDNDGHPTPLPRLKPETADDIRRHEHAQLRVLARQELKQRIRISGHI